jgi:DNA repair protein SbcD/Mre11
MRIAHLADLHLGRVFHGLSLLDDQRHALDQVLLALRTHRVEVLVLAGDLYDRALPSADAVRLFDGFLRDVNEGLKIPVIAIAGNHDSADHLGFGSWLFSRGDVHVRGRAERETFPITLEDEDGEVIFYPIPYIEPELARALLGIADTESFTHKDAVCALVSEARRHRVLHPNARAVLIAHAFVQGERRPDEARQSERALYLGAAGAVQTSELAGFDYVALGHLHHPQNLVSNQTVRYAGSLLKYSFGEVDDNKGMTLVDLTPKHTHVSHISIVPTRDLAKLCGSLDDLLVDPKLEAFRNHLLSIELTDQPPPIQAAERLRARFPHVAELRFRRMENPINLVPEAPPPTHDPESVFGEFMQRYLGTAASKAEQEVFRDALQRARTRT